MSLISARNTATGCCGLSARAPGSFWCRWRRLSAVRSTVRSTDAPPGDALAGVVLERWAEIDGGDLRMNCDTCAYRVALPGFEAKVGAPQTPHDHPDDPAHRHSHDHEHV